jgi:hypothetical protein
LNKPKLPRKMNQEEKWVEEYLLYRGFTNIKFEPDGNVPPDFRIDGNIAIEVRRLNENYESKPGSWQGVEELAISRWKRMEALFEELGPPTDGVSWYVFYNFQRPQLRGDWEAVLRQELEALQSTSVTDGRKVIEIDRHFVLTLQGKSTPGRLRFLLGAENDLDADGGLVIEELKKNVTICIDDKTPKIAPYRAKYPEWWLILVDFIFGGVSEIVQVKHDWDKVLIVHPRDYSLAYEVQKVL